MKNYADPKKVDEIILWLEHTPDLPLSELQYNTRQLASQHYWYCKLLAEAMKDYRQARYSRKALYAQKLAWYRPQCKSNADAVAKVEADEEYRKSYAAEYDAQAREEGAKRICGAISVALSTMRQEIADLRKEKEYTRFTDGSPVPGNAPRTT
ncbi:MAG: hypothetical protein AAFP08_01920 [Bacteroidota bacterium]